MTAAVQAAPQARTRTTDAVRLTFGRMLRSEVLKLMTLRSTWWSIAVVAVLSIGMSALIAGALSSNLANAPAKALAGTVPMAVIAPIQFTMLLAGALGAIAITGEYSTGMIRSTLTAAPRRGGVLAAKAIVVAALLAVVSLVVFVVALVPVTLILHTSVAPTGDLWLTARPILFASLSMAVFAVLGLSFGFVLRNGPGAIAATVGVLFVLPIVGAIFPAEGSWAWIRHLAAYLPMSAAQAVTAAPGSTGPLDFPVALLTLGCWVVAGIGSAWLVLRSRDA